MTSRPRVLVVDDEPLMARAVQRALNDEFDVRVELSAVKARERLASGERFDLILSDLMMPEMTGADLFRWMEQECPDQAARVLFVTGGSHEEALQQFLQTVSDRVVSKPFDRQQLVTRMRALLRVV